MDTFTETEKIKELIKEVPASNIPIKTAPPEQAPIANPITVSTQHWTAASSKLLNKYNYGNSLGRYGSQKEDFDTLFKRISEAIISMIQNEFATRNESAENLNLHFQALTSILRIIAKDVESKKLEGLVARDLAVTLHGFAEAYAMNFKTK